MHIPPKSAEVRKTPADFAFVGNCAPLEFARDIHLSDDSSEIYL